MKHKLCKMNFLTDIHFGNGMLSDGEMTIYADTLFSALCHEALKKEETKGIERLVSYVKDGKIRISDVFPYNKDDFFLPTPCLEVNQFYYEDAKQYKVAKSLKFISSKKLQDYLDGTLNFLEEYEKIGNIGKQSSHVRASIQGLAKANPYHVGSFQFCEGCGLYFILAYEDEEVLENIEQLIYALSFTGIGGKTSSGYGKFKYNGGIDVSEDWEKHLNESNELDNKYMSLSVSLPKEAELENALETANYHLLKRSGFVFLGSFTQNKVGKELRKQNLYVFNHGSCFKNTFEGDLYDVSNYVMKEMHPVYRYAKPMFWRVR